MAAPDLMAQAREALYQAGIKTTDGRSAREMSDLEAHQAIDALVSHLHTMGAVMAQLVAEFTAAARRLGEVLEHHPAILQLAVSVDAAHDTPIGGA